MRDMETTRQASTESSGEEVVLMLSDQLAIYERLRRLVDRQHGLIERDDTTPLLALLAERRKLTDDLAVSAAKLAPVRKGWDSVRERMSAQQRKEADLLLSRAEEHLKAIVTSDSRDVSQLEVRKRRVSAEMRAMPAAGAMLSAYGRAGSAPSEGFDRLDGDA